MEQDALILTATALMALDGLHEQAEQEGDRALLEVLGPAIVAMHDVRRVVQDSSRIPVGSVSS